MQQTLIIQEQLKIFEQYLEKSVVSEDPLISSTALHILKAGGKRVRPSFAIAAARVNGCEIEKLLPLMAALELIHTSSLIHDDVIDGSDTRRKMPTINALYGNKTAVYIGDFIVGRSFQVISYYKDLRILDSFNKTVLEMCRGELRQLADAYRIGQNIRDYFYRIQRKTALLFATSCECGACVSGASDEQIGILRRYGYYLGMAFQITDDILDMVSEESVLGKPVGSDLRQGNLSLPVIYSLQNSYWKEKLGQFILNSKEDPAEIEKIIAMVNQAGGLDYAEEIAERFIKKAMLEIDKLPESDAVNVLKGVASHLAKRKY
jgi:heptaprenyl diphosphate synthase